MDKRTGSVLLARLWLAVPAQRPGRLVARALEQGGADRLREGGIVDAQRDVIAGAFASLVPACADLRAFAAIAAMDPPVRRLVGVARLGRNDRDTDVERRRLDDAFVAAGGAEKAADLQLLDQALSQTGRFNLVFEGIADYPQARYLILSRDELNAYRAAILLENEDELAKELVSNPEKYKGRKLDLEWMIRNEEEAVYISGRLHR